MGFIFLYLIQLIWFYRSQKIINYYESRCFLMHIDYIRAKESRFNSLIFLFIISISYLLFLILNRVAP